MAPRPHRPGGVMAGPTDSIKSLWSRIARKAEDTDEASKILEDLAARDVIPDAEAWASLAVVRNRKQDTAGSDAAMAQCKKVARGGRRNPVCKIPAVD